MRYCCLAVFFGLLILSKSIAQTGDFNGDTIFDCHDIELMQAAQRTQDLQFDLSHDGIVDYHDTSAWLALASDVIGREIRSHDFDVDGDVDHRDFLTMSANMFTDVSGWCRGDFDGDGQVNHFDRTLFSLYYSSRPGDRNRGTAQLPPLPVPREAWSEDGVVFARTEQFDLIARPQTAPAGVLVTHVAARMRDDAHEFVTVDGLAITGDLHQVFLPGPFFSPTTPTARQLEGWSEDWIAYDSHLLITDLMVAHAITVGFSEIIEYSNMSDPVGVSDELTYEFVPGHTVTPILGIGNIESVLETEIFALQGAVRGNELLIAQIVTPILTDGEFGEVLLTIGLQGADRGNQIIADVGLLESVSIPFFYSPCDFDKDGNCELDDLSEMYAVLGQQDPRFNMDENPVINDADIRAWLGYASDRETLLLPGDSDLDGDIDSVDLNRVGVNWLAEGDLRWPDGDFNGDGVVNASDLNDVGKNWLHGVPTRALVPEPSAEWMMVFGFAFLWRFLVPLGSRHPPRSFHRSYACRRFDWHGTMF